MSTRSLIDSTLLTGLVEMEKQNTLLSLPAPTIGMLEVSFHCITTPWNDGSITSMYDSIVRLARRCQSYADVNVCMSAKSLLMVCNSVSVPRAPALLYVSRAAANRQRQEPTTAPERAAPALMDGIEKARAEIARAQRADEEMKKKKAEEKRRKQNEEAEERIRKRAKVEEAPLIRQQDTVKFVEAKPSRKEDDSKEEKAKPAEPQPKIDKAVLEEPESPEPVPRRDAKRKNDETTDPAPSDKGDVSTEEDGDGDFDFPEIVQGGGPDSDDE